jgi:formyltetrahydrofolate deformylase
MLILKLNCPDRVGLLARITGFFAALGANLQEVHQFSDAQTAWFFTRMEIDPTQLKLSVDELRRSFEPIALELGAEWSLREASAKTRVVILVSKADHCLADLLWRWKSGDLNMDLPCVISNHEALRGLVEREGIPFHFIPIEPGRKEAGFAAVRQAFLDAGGDTLVLARYMQILPDAFCREFSGHVLNIHHSFLPAFVGANPYKRAHARGVKLIGATCHYATAELDEGPIIEQEVMRVEHFHTPEDLLRLGRDCERMALARGLRYHVHDRVLIHGQRTVVFRD